MKFNRICTTALLLGAAAIATPAFAQDQSASGASNSQSGGANTAQASDNASASANTNSQGNAGSQTADASAGGQNNVAGQAAMDDTKMNASGNSQTAANGGSGSDVGSRSAANANVDGVGTTSKKYRRGSRAADYAKEQEITKQLNSQAASAASPSGNNRL